MLGIFLLSGKINLGFMQKKKKFLPFISLFYSVYIISSDTKLTKALGEDDRCFDLVTFGRYFPSFYFPC